MVNWWWVRHGPTHRHEMNGWSDVPADLSDVVALDRLAAFLPQEAHILSSDLVRAVRTADAIARGRPRLPHEPALREIHFGAWEGRVFDDIERQDPHLIRRFWEAPGDTCPPGGESWNALCERVNRAVDARIADESAGGGDIIAVAHFGTILSQVQRARGCSATEILGERIDNLSVTRLIREGRRWSIGEVNLVV